MKDNKTFTLTDNLLPAVIIREHIQKILRAEDPLTFCSDVEKLEDLLSTEVDEKYEVEMKEIGAETKSLTITPGGKLTRDNIDDFRQYEAMKKNQFAKRLTFRALVKLAKRKGIWLVDEVEAIISHDKKKVTSTDGK